MRYSSFILFLTLLVCACGNIDSAAPAGSIKNPADSFEIRWNNPFYDPNCNRIYISNYEQSAQSGNYIVGCAEEGNASVLNRVVSDKQLGLTSDQISMVDKALGSISLDTLEERYRRNDGIADGVTFNVKLRSSSNLKELSVDASSSISSPVLVQLLNILDTLGFLEESGYPI